MAKTSDNVGSIVYESITCPDCSGERFQVHERGAVVRGPDGALSVAYDELALQCLGCHHVMTMPVKGLVEYRA